MNLWHVRRLAALVVSDAAVARQRRVV